MFLVMALLAQEEGLVATVDRAAADATPPSVEIAPPQSKISLWRDLELEMKSDSSQDTDVTRIAAFATDSHDRVDPTAWEITPFRGAQEPPQLLSERAPPCETLALWRKLASEREAYQDVASTIARGVLAVPAFATAAATWLLLPGRIEFNGVTLFDQTTGGADFGETFVRIFVRSELSFLTGLQNSLVSTISVSQGFEQPDPHVFDALQGRVLVDSFRRTYRETYHIPALDFDTVVSAFTTGGMIDGLLVPAAIVCYAARFGIQRSWRVTQDLRVTFQIERTHHLWSSLNDDAMHRIATVGIKAFHLPVSLFVIIDGGGDGNGPAAEVGFVGVGTDLTAVLQCVSGATGRSVLR